NFISLCSFAKAPRRPGVYRTDKLRPVFSPVSIPLDLTSSKKPVIAATGAKLPVVSGSLTCHHGGGNLTPASEVAPPGGSRLHQSALKDHSGRSVRDRLQTDPAG